mmetsp:Transcript_32669/g.70062  ORF Transcript_32669/g.70062 Transcript_32669/m.70062 type:complete len:80 (-) Transcript_32669:60-299(-)
MFPSERAAPQRQSILERPREYSPQEEALFYSFPGPGKEAKTHRTLIQARLGLTPPHFHWVPDLRGWPASPMKLRALRVQ